MKKPHVAAPAAVDPPPPQKGGCFIYDEATGTHVPAAPKPAIADQPEDMSHE